MNSLEKTIETLETRLNELTNISIEEQKDNPVLMIAVTASIKEIAGLLFLFYKI